MKINICGTKYTNDDVSVELAKNALGVQNACNLSGVIFSMARDMQKLCDHPRCTGTAWKNHHPVIVMYLAQITSLATGGLIDIDAYYKASDLCSDVVDQNDVAEIKMIEHAKVLALEAESNSEVCR